MLISAMMQAIGSLLAALILVPADAVTPEEATVAS
jgi:hypothetical protein